MVTNCVSTNQRAGKGNSRMRKLGNSRMQNLEPEILWLIIRGFRSKMKANGLNYAGNGSFKEAIMFLVHPPFNSLLVSFTAEQQI